MANYDRIKTGMKLPEVERILGPGKEQSSADGGFMVGKAASYSWQEGFRTIIVIVVNGKVQSKSQVGL